MLERLERHVFIVACVMLAALAAARIYSQFATPSSAAQTALMNPLTAGTDVAAYIPADFHTAMKNVVLIVNSGCHFCQESMPFYRRMAALRKDGAIRLIATSMEPDVSLQQYLTTSNLAVDAAVQYKISLPVRGTPTLLVTDNKGRVQRSWLGQLTADQEKEVLAFLTT